MVFDSEWYVTNMTVSLEDRGVARNLIWVGMLTSQCNWICPGSRRQNNHI